MASESKKTAASESKKATEYYLHKARAARAEPDYFWFLDAPAIQRIAASARNELAVAGEKDDTPGLLVAEDFAPLTWRDLLQAQLDHSYAAVALPRPPAPAEPAPPTSLPEAIAAAAEARRRTGVAIDGNRSDKARAATLREAIFGGRTPSATRPSWETELETMIAAILALPSCPTAVRNLLPRLQKALATLKALPPNVGRPSLQPLAPPVPVQEAILAIHLALGDLLSHASGQATDTRLGALTRIIMGRRKHDGEKSASGAPPVPPEGTEPPPPTPAGTEKPASGG